MAVKKENRMIGKVIGNHNGYRIRHLKKNGGRIGIFVGKKQFSSNTFGSKHEAVEYLKALIQ
jgi:hypothetical protein